MDRPVWLTKFPSGYLLRSGRLVHLRAVDAVADLEEGPAPAGTRPPHDTASRNELGSVAKPLPRRGMIHRDSGVRERSRRRLEVIDW